MLYLLTFSKMMNWRIKEPKRTAVAMTTTFAVARSGRLTSEAGHALMLSGSEASLRYSSTMASMSVSVEVSADVSVP